MQHTQKTLKNGLNTLFVHSPGSKAASVQIWFRAGSALEKSSEYGIAHFLEHMFFKGTKKRPGSQIASEVESFGGEINAFTSFDYTCYYINCPADKIEKTIQILMDMVSNPLFSEKDIVPERHVVHEEFRRSLDSPNQLNFNNIQKTSFTGGYKHSILGTQKNILNFSKEQLLSFRKRFYNLENAMLMVAGNIKNQAKLEKTIQAFKLPSGESSNFPLFKLGKKNVPSTHKTHTTQASVTFTIQAPKYNELDGSYEDLAMNCLAYGEISPLYKALVTDSTLASSVSGSTMFFSKGGVHFLKVVAPEKSIKKALKLFSKTLKEVLKTGFNEEDMKRIQNQYVASKIYEKESIESHSFALGHGFAQSGDIYCENKFITGIKNASATEVNNALRSIFSKTLHATIQLPNESKITLDKDVLAFQNQIQSIYPFKDKKELKAQVSEFDPEAKLIQIKKGIKLLYRQSKMTPTFILHAYLKGGLSHEDEKTNGSYYLLSRLLTHGYENKEYTDIKLDLEKKSSYLNGFSGKNAYGLTLHGLSEHFNELVTHFKNTLLKPSFPKSYLDIEKELVLRALKNQKQDALKQCFKEVNKIVFNGHPYQKSVLGTEESITSIDTKILKNIHEKSLEESEIVLTYCGDQELSVVKKSLSKLFDQLEPRKQKLKKSHKWSPIKGARRKLDFDREQSQIFIGRPSFASKNKNDLLLKIFTTHLSGQSSELFVEVRDKKGLCYSVQAIQHTALEAGYWGIYIGAGKDKVSDAKNAILDLLKKYQEKGFTKAQFNRVKKMIQGQNSMSLQTNDDYANFYSIAVLHDLGLDYQHKSYEQMNKITLEEFNSFLKKFLKTNWSIVEAG